MFSSKDYSYYDGIPKKYTSFKNKAFQDWEIPPWNLLINEEKKLGKGNFGTVYMAMWNGTPVVAKVINDSVPEEKKELLKKEFHVLTKMHHPNVVQLLGYVSDPFIIVMEYLPNGELLDYINNNKWLSFSKKINICIDIMRALCYLHNREPKYLIHRDLKPQNILITESGSAKIADFGISRLFSRKIEQSVSLDSTIELNKENNDDLTLFVGALRYMAPEVKKRETYDYKIDIWSAGIIFSELFENRRYNEFFYWSKTPMIVRSLILNCMLQDDPNKRCNAEYIINELLQINRKQWCCF